jgi:hypothetical protein
VKKNEFEELTWHIGHEVEIVSYGRNGTIYNVSVECIDCGMVLMSFDNPKTVQSEESQPQVISAATGAT